MSKRFVKPAVGERVRVTIDWTEHYKTYGTPGTWLQTIFTSVGEVVPGERFDSSDSFRLKVDDYWWPVKVIALRWVSNIEYLDGTEALTVDESETIEPMQVVIDGSKGAKYIVTLTARGIYTCECKGFGFRGACKHIDQVKAEARGDK